MAAADSIHDPLNPYLNTTKALELEKAYQYDYSSVTQKMKVTRTGETDFVRIEFTSENPDLAYFAVEKFVERFLEQYYEQENSVETNSVAFYQQLAQTKKERLDSLMAMLNQYEQNKLLVNLEDQGKAVVAQLKEMELTREQEKKQIEGYGQAISNLDRQISSVNREFNNEDFARNVFVKSDVQELGAQIQALNEAYVTSGMKNESLRRQAEELRLKREKLAKEYASASKDVRKEGMTDVSRDWLKDKVALENKKMIATESVRSLEREINRLRGLKGSLVSSNSYVGNLRQDVDLAKDDYTATVQKLEQARLNYQDQERPLRVVEPPVLPTRPESSKAALLSVFAGVTSALLAAIVIVLLAFFDNSLKSPLQFRKFVKLPLLSVVNRLPKKYRDLNFVFNQDDSTFELSYFKETLRRLRHDIENSGSRVFLFTSPKQQEGKSFLIVALAYALGLKNKKVLIIDTNFKNNTLTLFANGSALSQPLNDKKGALPIGKHEGTNLTINAKLYNVDIIGNRQGQNSPSEILDETSFKSQLDVFRQRYDYIFLESANINNYTDTRELISFVDKVIPVFAATSKINNKDQDAVRYLHSLNGKMFGAVLNGVAIQNVND